MPGGPASDQTSQPGSAEARGARPERRGSWLCVVVGVLLIACAAVAALNRERYGVFAPWATPTRIHYCGRDFQAGSIVRGSPASLLASESSHPRWERISATMWGTPIYAGVVRSRPGSVCTMLLYLSAGANTYRAYVLEGGP